MANFVRSERFRSGYRFLGVLVANILPAENIPVEPEQGNACAGKV